LNLSYHGEDVGDVEDVEDIKEKKGLKCGRQEEIDCRLQLRKEVVVGGWCLVWLTYLLEDHSDGEKFSDFSTRSNSFAPSLLDQPTIFSKKTVILLIFN
jgi:hypothetical protein